jgi:tetratricopeptide (TPR) repeat protein
VTDLALRVDGELRRRRALEPTDERRIELAACLVRHGAADDALLELDGVSGDAAAALRLSACKTLPPQQRSRVWADLANTAHEGRTGFDLALLAGEEARAEHIANATAEPDLRAELSLRRGLDAPSPTPLHEARRAWLREDLDAVLKHASDGLGAESSLLAAAATRRRGDLHAARQFLDRARAEARAPMPGVGLETLLQHLARFRIRVRERDLLEPLLLIGAPNDATAWLPSMSGLRRALMALDREIGPFRGEILTRMVSGRLRVLPHVDDIRYRAASLRTLLRVLDLERVLALAEEIDLPHNPIVPAYTAELLHWHGRYDEAGAHCEEAIRRDPTVRWPWIGLAQAHMWTGNLKLAAEALERVGRRHPRLPSLPMARGELAFLSGDPGRAVTFLRAAASAHPTRRAVWLLLIEALRANGERVEADQLSYRVEASWPEAWIGDPQFQLTALRGNRSSSFVTLFPEGQSALLLQGPRLAP